MATPSDKPKYHISRNGNIKTYDSRLGHDGELKSLDRTVDGPKGFAKAKALCEFIRSKMASPPRVLIHCSGFHDEVTTESSETVIDFDFFIDLSRYIIPQDQPPIWIKADHDPAYRGLWRLQIDETSIEKTILRVEDAERGASISHLTHRRLATSLENKMKAVREDDRRLDGMPRWSLYPEQDGSTVVGLESEPSFRCHRDAVRVDVRHTPPADPRPSQRTLEDWAQEYCRSRKPIKEFRFRKEVYGWNMAGLQGEVNQILSRNHPSACTTWTTTVTVDHSDVVIRHGFLWILIASGWVQFITWITFLYPIIIWPLNRYLLGGRWDVAGCSYPFQRWIHLDNSYAGETVHGYEDRPEPEYSDLALRSLGKDPRLKSTPRGISQLVGITYGDALNDWKALIAGHAMSGVKSQSVITNRGRMPTYPGRIPAPEP